MKGVSATLRKHLSRRSTFYCKYRNRCWSVCVYVHKSILLRTCTGKVHLELAFETGNVFAGTKLVSELSKYLESLYWSI